MGCKVRELGPAEFRFLMDPSEPQSGVLLMAVGSVHGGRPEQSCPTVSVVVLSLQSHEHSFLWKYML